MAQINEWLSITQTEGKGDATITLTASSSRELQERVQSLQITTQTKTNYLNIKQKAFAPSITLSNTELTFTDVLLQNTTTIISNVEWTAVPSANWINISQLSGESGTTTLIVDVTSINSPTENRTGYIDFYWGDELMKTVEIKQEFEVVFELSKNNVTITNETIATINVTSNTTWYCKSDNEWVIINPTTLNGSGVITITASEYDGVERTGSINFYVGDKKVDSLTIKQLYLPEDVEIPEDITGCFYIEPYDNNNSVSISFYDKYNTTTISSGQYGAFEYYQNNEWKTIGIENSGGYIHTFNDNYLEFSKRIYFRNPMLTSYMRISFSGEFNMGGVFKIGRLNGFFIDTSIVNAKNLILSATLNESYCYAHAFQGCKKLITAPQLPATSLPAGAYSNMFEGCINLKKSPILPAPTLSQDAYYYMFRGCSNLEEITILATNISNYGCLNMWVYGVKSKGIFNKIKEVNYPSGSSGIPECWLFDGIEFDISSLNIDITTGEKTIIINSNVNWTTDYSDTWYTLSQTSGGIGETIITISPVGNNETTLKSVLKFYYGDNVIEKVNINNNPLPPENCFYIEPINSYCWVSINYTTYDRILDNDCVYYFNNGEWKKLDFDTSTKITEKTYFKNYKKTYSEISNVVVTSYLSIREPCNIGGDITTLLGGMKNNYAYQLFKGSKIVDASNLILPATTLSNYCYQQMFMNCASLTTAPELPATTLVHRCYQQMFANNTALNYIKCYAENVSAYNLDMWVKSVSPTGTFVKKAGVEYPIGNSGIPSGWTIQEF